MLVNDEGVAILSLLKIQSGPLGNLWDYPFDGDEMNLHMPQDIEAETELRCLAAVPYQIISPANNAPIIGIYQDSMLGCHLFTQENVMFEKRRAMNMLMMSTRIDEKKLLGDTRVSNFELLSQIMPPLSLKYNTKPLNEEKTRRPLTRFWRLWMADMCADR